MGFDIVKFSVAVYAVTMLILYCNGFVLSDVETSVNIAGDGIAKDKVIAELKEERMTIGHFARHVLCKNYEGKRNLYKALKKKACDVSLSMIQRVVLDLCRRKGHMLNKWVEELFDIDGDGYISHFEKHYHT